jgi:hypothetical protein
VSCPDPPHADAPEDPAALLVEPWREQRPDGVEQLALDFDRGERVRSSCPLSDLALVRPGADAQDIEDRLTSLVLNGVTSANSRRAYAAGLRQFFTWAREQAPRPFNKVLVQEYRSWLDSQKLSPATINLRLSPIRKLAREMRDNGLIDPLLALGIENVP